VAYPTEAVYGLGCDPLNEGAVLALQRLKRRSAKKGLILIAANLSQLDGYLGTLPDAVRHNMLAVSGRATTWVVPAKATVPRWLTGAYSTIAVRLVQHPLAKELCDLAQMPIVSTSANLSGHAASTCAYRTRLKFSSRGVYTINGRVGEASEPSQIINALTGEQLR